jgi:hypothetical protein
MPDVVPVVRAVTSLERVNRVPTAELLVKLASIVSTVDAVGYALIVAHGTIRIFSTSHCNIWPASVRLRAVSNDKNPRCRVVIDVVMAKTITIDPIITSTIVNAARSFVRVNRCRGLTAFKPTLNLFFTSCIGFKTLD